MTVYIVTETYRYEDENGGSVYAVYEDEAAADAAASKLAAENGPNNDYDVAVERWIVHGREEVK